MGFTPPPDRLCFPYRFVFYVYLINLRHRLESAAQRAAERAGRRENISVNKSSHSDARVVRRAEISLPPPQACRFCSIELDREFLFLTIVS
jgi:hypothetical protein